MSWNASIFECKLETLAELVEAGLVSVVMGDLLDIFWIMKTKDAYELFFKNLKSEAPPVTYSNYYEDAILNSTEKIITEDGKVIFDKDK